MREYTVRRADERPPLTGAPEGPWAGADSLDIDCHPWDTGRDRQHTEARALYDDDALTLQYVCEDSHIEASATELNGPVWEDSCVEFFAAPHDDRPHYANFEGNCCGTFLMGYGPKEDRTHVEPATAAAVEVATSVAGPTKEPAPDDSGWWLAVRLPYSVLSALAGADIDPGPGTEWRANCYRIGGGTEYAAWNPVDAPEPDFHRPDSFGRFVFA
ncbi:MAG: carbohydrate-binding family 9-like protein [Halobacteriaceae archaeon]